MAEHARETFHRVSQRFKRLIQQFYNIGQLTQFAVSLQGR